MRTCREFAEANGLDVPDELIFVDRGKGGGRRRREGMGALLQALENNDFDVLLVFKTSRLNRKLYRTLAFVEEEIVSRSKRCVFVKSGIDTDDRTRWRTMLQMHGMVDELGVQMGAEHIRAAHIGLLEQELVFGAITFGYTGETIPGQTNRANKPRRKLAIKSEEAEWVRRVFQWFAFDGLTVAECGRRLNREKAPLPAGCTTGMWTRQAVHWMLSNARYRGHWSYGVDEHRYLAKQDYIRAFRRDKPLKSRQIERLRIIDEHTWHRAQQRLAQYSERGGRKAKQPNRRRRPCVLNGLFYCEAHNRRLNATGAYGCYLTCPVCRRVPKPALFSMLSRELALTVITRECTNLLRLDAALVDRIKSYCRQHSEDAQRPDPKHVGRLNERKAKLVARIQFILENPGDSSDDRRQSESTLKAARRERDALQAEIAALEAAAAHPIRIPTDEELQAMIEDLV